MVPQISSPGARIALSKVQHCCAPPCQQWRALSTTRRHPTSDRPLRLRALRPLAIEHHRALGGSRSYATASTTAINAKKDRPRHIAVIGGGLTGLSTAWFLTKFMPEAKVTIYEGSGRLGGWIDTEKIPVKSENGKDGFVRFERGARLVQPKTTIQNWDDIAFYELWTDINPSGTSWSTTEVYDRYFYYPDHLVRLPSIPGMDKDAVGTVKAVWKLLLDLFREPLYTGLVPFALNILRRKTKPKDMADVSIGDEFLRRGGGVREPVDNMLSAMCHGIYGGDVWKLSCESSIFSASFVNKRMRRMYVPQLPAGARRAWWSRGVVPVLAQDTDILINAGEPENLPVLALMRHQTRFKSLSIADGFEALPASIAKKLKANPNVKFVSEKGAKVQLAATGRVEIKTTTNSKQQYDKVISTIYSKTLATLASPSNSLPSLASSTAVTIRLVNLWSPHPKLNHPHHGFGYLIPQTTPANQNPHAALGVIFDSDRTLPPKNRFATEPTTGDSVPGTKLTVMLGGHHWDDIPPSFLPAAATDDEAAIRAAKETVAIQLGIPEEAWQVSSTKLCVDCIPQHTVGHSARMARADEELRRTFKGKLAVAGGSYTAPGVMGSVRAARDVAFQVSGGDYRKGGETGIGEEWKEVEWSVGDTGLRRFVGGPFRLWIPVPLKQLKEMRGIQ